MSDAQWTFIIERIKIRYSDEGDIKKDFLTDQIETRLKRHTDRNYKVTITEED